MYLQPSLFLFVALVQPIQFHSKLTYSAERAHTSKLILYLLAKQRESGIVRGESQHHQISVEAIKAMASVGIVVGLRSLPTNEVHDFVLALTRAIVTREINVNVLPRSEKRGRRKITNDNEEKVVIMGRCWLEKVKR